MVSAAAQPAHRAISTCAQYACHPRRSRCCFIDSTANAGVYNGFTCPLPDGAAKYCNAICGNTPVPIYDDDGPPDDDGDTASTEADLAKSNAAMRLAMAADHARVQSRLAANPPPGPSACNSKCTRKSPALESGDFRVAPTKADPIVTLEKQNTKVY